MKTPSDPSGTPEASFGKTSSSPSPEAEEHRRLIAENDALILSPDLDNGLAIVTERTAIFTRAIARWAAGQQAAFGYERPFAVVATGGTGRGEVTPCSDLDIALLFEDDVEKEPCRAFVMALQKGTVNGSDFRERYGFRFTAMPYGMADVPNLRDKDLNAFLDMAAIHDPDGLVERFRNRIRETFDPFEHFLHVRDLWQRQSERTGAVADRIDRFDLKNDAQRLFLCGIWTLAGKEFLPSRTIYARLASSDPRDLEAFHFLLRLRCWIHLRRPPGGLPTALGNHAEDVMSFDDFDSFGDWLDPDTDESRRFEFAEEVRSRLLSARRRIAAFSRGIIESELRPGRRISPGHPVALGAGGLYHANPETCVTNSDRSRAALSLLLMAQRYGLPVDSCELLTTFRHAGDWLEPVVELGALFLESRGSLAGTFDFLSRIPGAEDRLFPGYGKFESSLDGRVRTERQTLRGPLEREKMRALEDDRREGLRLLAEAREPEKLTDVGYEIRVEVEAARLTENQLAAVKLAIKTKRLPVSPDDILVRNDERRSPSDRYSRGFSGIPLDDYYRQCFSGAGFDDATLDLARFLVANRRTLGEIAAPGLIDATAVKDLLQRCGGDPGRLRSLYVFTHMDHHAWESPEEKPTLFFNIRELYAKACMPEEKRFNPKRLLGDAGLRDSESQDILMDFGRDFFEGIYRHYAVRFGPHLLRLAESGPGGKPKAMSITAGPSTILGVAARDDRGIAASISGALWKLGVGLRQAHLFSATNRGLALDFFHLAPPDRDCRSEATSPDIDLGKQVETAIRERLHLSDADEAALPDVARQVTLTEWRPGLYRLRAESEGEVGALIYLLCCKACRQLRADVYGLASQSDRNGSWAVVYLALPPTLALEDAREIVAKWG